MKALGKLLAKHCRILSVVAVLSVIAPACFLPKLNIDNSIEVWLEPNSSQYKVYRSFLRQFGSEEFVVVAATVEDPFGQESLDWQKDLAGKLREVEGVSEVLDLPGVAGALWAGQEDWKEEAARSQLLSNLLLGADGRTVGMFVWVKALNGPKARRQTVEKIEQVVASAARNGFEPHLAGTSLLNVELDRGSVKASATFLPLAVLLGVIILAVMLRSVRLVVVALLAVGVATAWAMGIMVLNGRSMNMVTAMLPALMFVLTLSNGIHLCTRFRSKLAQGMNSLESARSSLGDLIGPAFLSSVTTAVGFASLMISQMRPVQDFGLFAAIGMLVGFTANITIVPGLASLVCRRTSVSESAEKEHWTSRLGTTAARRAWLVISVGAVVLVLCLSGAVKARAESNVLKFFPDDSRIAKDYAFIAENLSGYYTVELDVKCAKEQEAATLGRMGKLAKSISSRPDVAKVTYLGDFLRASAQGLSEITDPEQLIQRTRLAQQVLVRYRHDADQEVHLRMSVLVRAMASDKFYDLLNYIDKESAKSLAESSTYEITGVVALLNEAQRRLVRTQIESLVAAALVVMVLIGIFFCSGKALIAAILPNLLPIGAVFGLMGWANIPLDAATVMIASVAIGIAADDTIHFLWHYRIAARTPIQLVQAVGQAFQKAGRAMVFTSIVAAAGFSILCLSQFRPVTYFGLLTGLTMLTVLAGDVVLLPACVRIMGLWKKQ